MNLNQEFPLKLFINLGPAEDRRRRVQNLFFDHGLDVERLPAVSKRYVKDARGHWDKGRYALALSQKLALREGRRRGMPAVLLFEDDIIFHPEWKKRVTALELPEDWGIFYLGCQHLEKPVIVSPGVVRTTKAWDLHAFAVRARYYKQVMRVLTPLGRQTLSTVEPSDRTIATLLRDIPAYAAWPNLAWQEHEHSSIAQGWVNDNYTSDGDQRRWLDALENLPDEMIVCGRTKAAPPTKIRFRPARPIHWNPSGMNVGLGDRLRGLAGMLAFAASAGRTLVVPWYETEACPGNFDDILKVDGLRVAKTTGAWTKWTASQVDCHDPYNIIPEVLWQQLHDGWFITPGVSLEAFIERWKSILRGFRPSDKVASVLARLLQEEPRENLLGVHIRRTDALGEVYRDVSEDDIPRLNEELLTALRRHWTAGTWTKVVLACDDAGTAETWLEILRSDGIPVIFHTKLWRANSLRQTSLVDAACDLFLLSRCGRVLASIMGSFAWMATTIGDIPLEVISRAKKGSAPFP